MAVGLEKIEDVQAMMSYAGISTLSVVIDDEVVHAGSISNRDSIQYWLER